MTFSIHDRVMPRALRASKVRGVRLAIVTDNKDGEGNPGYRVKVKFPWLSEQETTFWARIAVPMAGSGRGTYVLPEIDDQVLVVFEHGDIDRPILVGTLWSKQQEPVEVNQSGKNDTKLIKSRSGHRIIFDDQEGAETITIVDSTRKNKIVLDSANKIVKIESDGDIEVTARTNVIMHSNALKVGTREGVAGKAKSVLVHAAKTFSVKATSGITIGGGNTTINTSNAAACSVSGSGAGELGAAAVEAAKDQVAERDRGGGLAAAAARPVASASRAAPAPSARSTSPAAPAGQTEPPDKAPEPERVEFLVIDDDGRPVRGVKFGLTLADGAQADHVTDGDGAVVIEDAPAGRCTVATDIQGLVFESTLEIMVKTDGKWQNVSIPIRAPDDKTKLVGYLRTLTSEDRCAAVVKLTKLPKWQAPQVDPHAPKGAPPPPPPPKHWYDEEEVDESSDGFWSVEFETTKKKETQSTDVTFWVEGYVEKGRCLSITPKGFVLAAEGINVYDRVPGEVKDGKEGPPRYVARDFLVKDSTIAFKQPGKVKNGDYFELDKGGYVLVAENTVAPYEGNVEPVYGSIQTPRALIKKGEIVGYAGPYLFDRNCVHFEIVTGTMRVSKGTKPGTAKEVNESVCENAAGDAWGWPITVWIDKGASFQKKHQTGPKGTKPAANPPIAVNWQPGSILRPLDAEATDGVKDRRERYYKVTRAAVMGWIAKRSIEAAGLAAAAVPDPATGPDPETTDLEEDRVVVALGHASVKTEIPGLWRECPSPDPGSADAAVDVDVKIAAKKDLVVVGETFYRRCRFPDIEVEKTAVGYVDRDAVRNGVLTTAVAGLYRAWPSKSTTPDLSDGCPLAAGTHVDVLNAGNKKNPAGHLKIRYKYKEKQAFEGWVEARYVTELPPPRDAPAARNCKLADKIPGLYASPPAKPDGKYDPKRDFAAGTAGVILQDSKHFVQIIHKLEGEATGWAFLAPHGRCFDTVKSLGGDLLDEAVYFDHVDLARKKQPVLISSLYTDNPNATEISFEQDAGPSTEPMLVRLDNWIKQVVQRRWLKIDEHRYIDLDPKDGADQGKVVLLSPYDWPGWMVLEEEQTKAFSKNGICDVPDLVELTRKSLEHPDHKVTHEVVIKASKEHAPGVERIRDAYADPGIAGQLRRMSCLHPTEWDGDADDELAKYNELKERCGLTETMHKQTLDHIKKLQFWNELKASCRELPDCNAVWHYHPIGFLDNLRGFFAINQAQLKAIAPFARDEDLKVLVPHLNEMMFKYGINTRRRQAHFLAQCALESKSFRAPKEENKREFYLANYESRVDLVNFKPGDGERFCGRGLIQMTGRLKYMRYGAFVAENFVDEGAGAQGPRGIEAYPYRADSAGWVWSYDKPIDGNALADADDFERLTLNINGGYNAMDLRAGFLLRARKVLMG